MKTEEEKTIEWIQKRIEQTTIKIDKVKDIKAKWGQYVGLMASRRRLRRQLKDVQAGKTTRNRRKPQAMSAKSRDTFCRIETERHGFRL